MPIMIGEMRFISTSESVSSVWELMRYERDGNVTFEKLNAAGLLMQDRTGQWWHIMRATFNTPDVARDYAGFSGFNYDDEEIVVIDLTRTQCEAGTCPACNGSLCNALP